MNRECRTPSMVSLAHLLLVALHTSTAAAQAAPSPPDLRPAPPQQLDLAVGLGYLGSPGLGGAAITSGLRYLPIPHLALGFDVGYGVIRGNPDVQDRWWLIPSAALVLPAGPVHLDLGVGLGLGATSGYTSWPAYAAAPFGPVWAFQLVPTVRGHVMATMPLTERVDLYGRVELASLLLGGNSIGSRVNNPDPSAEDTLWFDLAVGVQFRLL